VADAFSNAISEYRIDAATGALTFQNVFPTAEPLGIAVTPSGRFAFVTNYLSNGSVSGFSIDATTGALTPIPGSPFRAGDHPYRLTVAPSGRFLYAVNLNSNNVSAFTINATTGALTPVPGSPFAVGTSPYQLAVSPSELFAYVANSASSNVSAFRIDPVTGALAPIQGSPFLIPGIAIEPWQWHRRGSFSTLRMLTPIRWLLTVLTPSPARLPPSPVRHSRHPQLRGTSPLILWDGTFMWRTLARTPIVRTAPSPSTVSIQQQERLRPSLDRRSPPVQLRILLR
jgi:hypothetical protein